MPTYLGRYAYMPVPYYLHGSSCSNAGWVVECEATQHFKVYRPAYGDLFESLTVYRRGI